MTDTSFGDKFADVGMESRYLRASIPSHCNTLGFRPLLEERVQRQNICYAALFHLTRRRTLRTKGKYLYSLKMQSRDIRQKESREYTLPMEKDEQVILIIDGQPLIKNYIFFEDIFYWQVYSTKLVVKLDKIALTRSQTPPIKIHRGQFWLAFLSSLIKNN